MVPDYGRRQVRYTFILPFNTLSLRNVDPFLLLQRSHWRDQLLCIWLREGPPPSQEDGPLLGKGIEAMQQSTLVLLC